MRVSSFLGFFLTTMWLGYFSAIASSAHPEATESDFLSAFAETMISLDGETAQSISELGSLYFNEQTLRHLKPIDKGQFKEDLFRTKLVFTMLAQPERSKQWELFLISPTLASAIGFESQDHWLTLSEVETKRDHFRRIANQQSDWGSFPAPVIAQCRALLDQYAFVKRVHSTFAVPNTNASYEARYLEWIVEQKIDLSAFQNKLEGIEPYDEAAAQKFKSRALSLNHLISDKNPLAVSSIQTTQNLHSWAPIQFQLLHSLEEWFIPISILDWAQMLDAATQSEWGIAIDKTLVIQSKQPSALTISPEDRFSFKNYLHFSFSLMFWVTQLLVTVLVLLFIGGVNRCYNLSALGLVLAGGIKWGCSFLGLNNGFSISLLPLSSAAWVAILILLFTLSALIENRKAAGVMLLAVIAISSVYTPELTSPTRQSALAQLIPFVLISGLTIAWIRVLQIWFIRTDQQSPRERFRSVDRMLYPAIPVLLLSLSVYLFEIPILQSENPTVPSAPLALTIIETFVALQLVRYLILRWINQLSASKAVFLYIGCLFLLSALAAAPKNAIATISIPVTIMSTLGLVSLSLSYLANHPWINWHRQPAAKK